MKQIEDKLFLDLCAFFLAKDESDERYERICKALEVKLDKAVARDTYTKSLLDNRKKTEP